MIGRMSGLQESVQWPTSVASQRFRLARPPRAITPPDADTHMPENMRVIDESTQTVRSAVSGSPDASAAETMPPMPNFAKVSHANESMANEPATGPNGRIGRRGVTRDLLCGWNRAGWTQIGGTKSMEFSATGDGGSGCK